MPRHARRVADSTVQHVASRFLDREYRFVDDLDRATYIRHVASVAKRGDCALLSYALMSTHVHLGVVAGSAPMARFFHPLHTRFAIAWHARHGGLGPVFASRPSSWHVPAARVARLIAYHHRNPVDAGVVEKPEDSRWTSHRYYLRLEPPPAWLNVERGLELCGFADTRAGRRHFGEFVREIVFDDPPWSAESRETSTHFASVAQAQITASTALAQFVAEGRGFESDVRQRRRPAHPTRRDFVRFALERGVTCVAIARLLNVTPPAIAHIARPNV